MKRIIPILLLLTLFACDSSLQIISTKKQTIIPGISTVKPYTKYLVEIALLSDATLKVDSVLVFEKGNECRRAIHFIKDPKSSNVVAEVNVKGKYIIDATVKENSVKVAKGCEESTNKIVVFYSRNNHRKKIEITSFTEETVRRR